MLCRGWEAAMASWLRCTGCLSCWWSYFPVFSSVILLFPLPVILCCLWLLGARTYCTKPKNARKQTPCDKRRVKKWLTDFWNHPLNFQVVTAVRVFVISVLGAKYVENPPATLPSLYADMTNLTPLVFVLSTGSDPIAAFMRFAQEMDYVDKLEVISLGQG